ncbi:hypothetical protein ACOIPA_004457, partial [Salmonella enterica]
MFFRDNMSNSVFRVSCNEEEKHHPHASRRDLPAISDQADMAGLVSNCRNAARFIVFHFLCSFTGKYSGYPEEGGGLTADLSKSASEKIDHKRSDTSMKQPTAGPACPEINALPEFLQDILKELYQHSLAEGYPDIFLNACKTLKEIIPEVKCPCIPYTIAWQLWFRGF